jgi:hypothetical protein
VAVVGAVLVLGLITLISGLSGRLIQMGALTWWVMLSWVCPVPLIVVVVRWLADDRFDGPIPRPAWLGAPGRWCWPPRWWRCTSSRD